RELGRGSLAPLPWPPPWSAGSSAPPASGRSATESGSGSGRVGRISAALRAGTPLPLLAIAQNLRDEGFVRLGGGGRGPDLQDRPASALAFLDALRMRDGGLVDERPERFPELGRDVPGCPVVVGPGQDQAGDGQPGVIEVAPALLDRLLEPPKARHAVEA